MASPGPTCRPPDTSRNSKWTEVGGIGTLFAASAVAAAGLTVVPDEWVGLLGLVPFALGVRSLVATIRSRKQGEEPDTPTAGNALTVAGVTIANGADNISVCTPLFRTVGWTTPR